MAKEHIHLAVSESGAKLPAGPIRLPTPGPELVIQPMMPLKATVKSSPVKANKNVKMTILKINELTKKNTEFIIVSSTANPATFTGVIRFGSVALIKDFFK